MLRTQVLGLLGLVACPLLACQAPLGLSETVVGSGQLLEESRAVSDFDHISVRGAMNLIVEVGGDYALSLTSDDNLLEHFDTRVRGKELVIEVKGPISSEWDFLARVSLPGLHRIRVRGKTELQVRGIDSETFRIDANGSCAGSVSGKTEDLEVDIIGSGRLDLRAFEASVVSIVIRGAGTVELGEPERLNVDVSGSASISYRGQPVIDVEEVGTLHLVQRED